MTIEEKAKAYDEALERARKLYNSEETSADVEIACETIFPELAESEDEKVRNAIIATIHLYYGEPLEDEAKEMIAWLEKQGIQKFIIPKFRVGDEIKAANEESLTITKIDEKGYWSGDLFICDFDEECIWDLVNKQKPVEWSENDDEIRKALIQGFNECLNSSSYPKNAQKYWHGIVIEDILAWLGKQGEQKPILDFNADDWYVSKVDGKIHNIYHSVDKVEPIFNVGDKIQYSKGCGTIMTIEKIENGEYIFANNMGHTTIENGNKCYLVENKDTWTEKDEKTWKELIEEVKDQLDSVPAPDCRDKEDEKVLKQLTRWLDWLKSFKGRVQLQAKEWSKDDKNHMANILNILLIEAKNAKVEQYRSSVESDIDWIYSLKNKYKNKSNI